MKISVEEEDKERVSFTLSKSSTAFANLVRRFSMSQVPTFAMDKVTIYENSSTVFDEYISHRLGLLPLKMGHGVRDDEEVMFSLEASGPGTVYSSQLQSTMDKVKVATDKIPLLRLLEGQNLRLEAKATAGIGRKHAKWQAGLAAYQIIGNETDYGNVDFKFEVESFMQLPPREILLKSTEIISKKCDELEKGLEAMKKEGKKKKE